MNAPIVDIIKDKIGYTNGWAISDEDYTELCEQAAKQIRQQIGRELLDPNKTTYGYTAEMIARIREVCQMEEKE